VTDSATIERIAAIMREPAARQRAEGQP